MADQQGQRSQYRMTWKEIEGRHKIAMPGGNMKKLSVSTVVVSAFSALLWFSPLQAGATSTASMKFDGTGGNSSGGVQTYPYYFTINGAKTEVPLLCVSYQDSIKTGETWTADVYAIGTSQALTGLTLTEQEEDAYFDSVILGSSNSTVVSDEQWAAWVVGDSSQLTTNYLEHNLGLSSSTVSSIDSDISTALAFADSSKTDLAGDPSFYAKYELYVPVSGSQPWGDGIPQTFIGPNPTVAPEPSSLVLFGSGLLSAAGALYRRKRRTAQA
jgi:PEP-CTERM motif